MGNCSPFPWGKKCFAQRNGLFNEIVADTFQSSCLLKVNETRDLVHLSEQSAVEQYYPVGYWTTI